LPRIAVTPPVAVATVHFAVSAVPLIAKALVTKLHGSESVAALFASFLASFHRLLATPLQKSAVQIAST